ncbi:flavin reductase [Salinarimonas soli]|uniref:Flavin reductase n=2 Tax=Salinarimonas soli TaxID=1638099 RepID=A0A5B2W0W7_9HYPH|nr:flavin reductase [Salinarimonas soli]
MSRVPGAVHLVSTDGPAGSGGFTATAVTSVADTPPTLLVCANGANRSCGRLIENGVFGVSTLSHADEELAAAFAGRTGIYGEDRFRLGRWTRLVTGSPVLETAIAGFDCRVIEARPLATHLVIFGEVVGVHLGPAQPALVYRGRRFHGL